jgi:hypothetical protein
MFPAFTSAIISFASASEFFVAIVKEFRLLSFTFVVKHMQK